MECVKRCSNIFVDNDGNIGCDFYDEKLDVEQDEHGDIFIIRCIECEEDKVYDESKEIDTKEIKRLLNTITNNVNIMIKSVKEHETNIYECIASINRILDHEKK